MKIVQKQIGRQDRLLAVPRKWKFLHNLWVRSLLLLLHPRLRRKTSLGKPSFSRKPILWTSFMKRFMKAHFYSNPSTYTKGRFYKRKFCLSVCLYVITFSFTLIDGIFFKKSDSFSKDWSLTFVSLLTRGWRLVETRVRRSENSPESKIFVAKTLNVSIAKKFTDKTCKARKFSNLVWMK